MDHRTHVSRDAVDTAFGFLTLQGAESPSLAEGQETHGTKRTQVTWTLLWRVFFFFLMQTVDHPRDSQVAQW